MRTVELNGVAYPYVFGMGSLLIYENLMGESLSDAAMGKLTATQTTVLHYACLCTGGPEFGYSFAEFSRMLTDRKAVEDLRIALEQELMRWNSVNTSEEAEDADDGKGEQEQAKKK